MPRWIRRKVNGVRFRFLKDRGKVFRSVDAWMDFVDHNHLWNASRNRFARKIDNKIDKLGG